MRVWEVGSEVLLLLLLLSFGLEREKRSCAGAKMEYVPVPVL